MSQLIAREYKRFEDIKHVRDDGSEYWLARELSIELDYAEWRNFSKVIDKARFACKNITTFAKKCVADLSVVSYNCQKRRS